MNLMVQYIMAMDTWNKPLVNPYPHEENHSLRLRGNSVKLETDHSSGTKNGENKIKKLNNGCSC